MERQGWAEAEAMLIEAMYAPSFEATMDAAVTKVFTIT
jgi:hypothetical protein